MQSIFEMTKDLPAFKSFCRRRSTVKRETWEQTFAKLRKKRASEFRSFCKPKGINSILKDNEFTTGFESETYGWERAKLTKVKGEFVCEIQGMDEEELLQRLIADYDRLIERTIQIKTIIAAQNEEADKLAA